MESAPAAAASRELFCATSAADFANTALLISSTEEGKGEAQLEFLRLRHPRCSCHGTQSRLSGHLPRLLCSPSIALRKALAQLMRRQLPAAFPGC